MCILCKLHQTTVILGEKTMGKSVRNLEHIQIYIRSEHWVMFSGGFPPLMIRDEFFIPFPWLVATVIYLVNNGWYMEIYIYIIYGYWWLYNIWLLVEPYPSEKWWTSSVGMMTFPNINGKIIQIVPNHQPFWWFLMCISLSYPSYTWQNSKIYHGLLAELRHTPTTVNGALVSGAVLRTLQGFP